MNHNIQSSKSIDISVLYEDNHLIVLNKKPGDLTQGDKTKDLPLPDIVKQYLKHKYNKPGNVFCGVVHRLDRPTSGVLLFAKTSKALERMNQQFRLKETIKIYWAIVEKKEINREGRLHHYLKKNSAKNKSYCVDKNTKGAKEAILNYKIIKELDNYFVMEIILETGRHHQIRTQLASIGCRIKGDLKYGAKRSNKNGSISLHAKKLEFTHPVSKEHICIDAPFPEDDIWNKQ